jgi:hypothetical protein
MTIDGLKAKVEAYREILAKEKNGKGVVFSESGPVGMSLVDAIVQALEALEKRVKAVEEAEGR